MISTDYVNSYVKRAVSLEVATNSSILSNQEVSTSSTHLLCMVSESQLILIGDNFQFERVKVAYTEEKKSYELVTTRKGQWFDNYKIIRNHLLSLQRVMRTCLRNRLDF